MKKEDKGGKFKNQLSTLVFVLAGYISLNILGNSLIYNVFGVLFFVAAIYGVLAINKRKSFIFN